MMMIFSIACSSTSLVNRAYHSEWIAAAQEEQDADLLQRAQKEPTHIGRQQLAPDVQVFCYIPYPDAEWSLALFRRQAELLRQK
jgi:hypothetical protein